MRRGELSGSAPLKELGASKTRPKDGSLQPSDSACAAITSYRPINRLSQGNGRTPTADQTPITQHLKDSTNDELGNDVLPVLHDMFYLAALKPVVNASNLLSKNVKL
ncbi:hypothetical protein WMY93_034204 [Mugilogobius chulae]|uniref:Uncharacterized protein n=1 Tax=Mugilogobius chulae TaxID=88201 RepID=A0AAW0MHW7_9GOBI